MGKRRFRARSVSKVPRNGLEGAAVRLYRILPLLASANPDICNLIVIRLATVIEEVCRRLLEVYLDANPDDDSMELIMRRVPFDSARRGGWGGAVAASLNVSTIGGVRSILDKCGASAALKGGVAEILTDVMVQRNMVVHGEGDATLDVAKAHRGVEEFARGAFRDSLPVQVMMDSAKASVAAHLPGHSRIAIELHESVIRRCEAVGRESLEPALLVYMGISCAALGRHGDALDAYDAAVGIDGSNAAAHAGRGDALAALGRHGDALDAYDAAVGIDGSSAAAHAGRGRSLASLGRHGDALAAYDAAVGIDGSSAAAHAGRGDALAALGRHGDALDAYDAAVGIDGSSAAAHAGRGRSLASLGRHGDALAAYDAAVGIDGESAAAHAGRGDALAALGRHGDALAAYDAAVGIDGSNAAAHAGRGRSLESLGRHGDALAAYDAAVGIDGSNAAAHAGRGDALAALGRHGDALAAYDAARRLARGPDRTRHA